MKRKASSQESEAASWLVAAAAAAQRILLVQISVGSDPFCHQIVEGTFTTSYFCRQTKKGTVPRNRSDNTARRSPNTRVALQK
ncbi:hypothetical protein M0802_000273 [Mischocyttarus mexicanus]|nr:hypothetical protein M0802_000273 [Mischocyttarus mexicanus]